MYNSDIHNVISAVVGVPAAAIATDTTTAGVIIDLQDASAIDFVLNTGAVTAGNATLLIEDGDAANLSDAETVPATHLLGTASAVTTADSVDRVGYIVRKRYVRASIVTAGTANLVAGVVAVTKPTISG